MHYTPISEAKEASGLRLALSAGGPSVWSEPVKGLFRVRKISYIPVAQLAGEANEELVSWTGHRNAPTAMYNDEPARTTSAEMIALADRLGSGPSLVPDDIDDRVKMFGLVHELAGEDGFGWNCRLLMQAGMVARIGAGAASANPMLQDYRFSPSAVPHALGKINSIVQVLTTLIERQRDKGSRYFFGNAISALDIYWACFSQMLAPLPHEDSPMPELLRNAFNGVSKAFQDAGYELSPMLLKHRDYIFPKYLQWPMDF